MKNKPELMTSAGSLQEVERYIAAGATAVTIGAEPFAMRLPGTMAIAEISKAAAFAHQNQAQIVVAVNAILENRMLEELPVFLRQIAQTDADAILFGDPAVLRAAKLHAPDAALYWSSEMTTTNYATANFWAARGARRAVLARELNLEQVLQFKAQAKLQVEVQVHGMTNIYHSKRKLLHHYVEHLGKAEAEQLFGMERSLYLVESERPDQTYPIYEDSHGTHIMSSEDLCMLEDLHELLAGDIDSLRIESLLKTPEYNEIVIRAYKAAIEAYFANPEDYVFDPQWLDSIRAVQDPKRELTFGFFYKEQVY